MKTKILGLLAVVMMSYSCSKEVDILEEERMELEKSSRELLIPEDGIGGSSNTNTATSNGTNNYLLFYSRDEGVGEIYELQSNGDLVDGHIYKATGWSHNWNIVRKYNVNGNPYILFYDDTHGIAEIYSIDSNTGKLKNLVKKYTGFAGGHFIWNFYWDEIQAYEAGGNTYLLFYDDRGVGEIYKMKSNGDIEKRVYRATGWSDSWDIVRKITVNGNPYMLFYDDRDGEAEIYSIDSNTGKLKNLVKKYTGFAGGNFIWNYYWDEIQSYQVGGVTYLLFYDDRGVGEIYKMKSNGEIGNRIYRATGWSDDWSIVKTYMINNNPYILFYDDSGIAEIYNINPNGTPKGLVKKYHGWSDEWDIIE